MQKSHFRLWALLGGGVVPVVGDPVVAFGHADLRVSEKIIIKRCPPPRPGGGQVAWRSGRLFRGFQRICVWGSSSGCVHNA